MIVYHLCPAADVPRFLTEGLSRAEGRHYVFDRWEDVQSIFAALDAAAPDGALEHVVLVLDLDRDMLVSAPIAPRRLPPTLPAQDLARLQARSRFPEVDVSARRIRDVKNAHGDSVRALRTARTRARRGVALPGLRAPLLEVRRRRDRRRPHQVPRTARFPVDAQGPA
ncbi:MAG: hypothetical protein NHB36_00045 [Nitrospira sp.]|nr:hypothetical protein [Nitrospira sp.]